jgi:sulfur carrier protein ThiS
MTVIQEAQIESAEIKLLRNVRDYTRKDQIRHVKIREELNILNLNAEILKSQWKYHVLRRGDRRIPKKIL